MKFGELKIFRVCAKIKKKTLLRDFNPNFIKFELKILRVLVKTQILRDLGVFRACFGVKSLDFVANLSQNLFKILNSELF